MGDILLRVLVVLVIFAVGAYAGTRRNRAELEMKTDHLNLERDVNAGLRTILARTHGRLHGAEADRDMLKRSIANQNKVVHRQNDELTQLRSRLRLVELQNSKYRTIYGSPGSPSSPSSTFGPQPRDLTVTDIHE